MPCYDRSGVTEIPKSEVETMRSAFSLVFAICLAAASLPARGEDGAMLAWRVIEKHRLLTPKMQKCASVAENDDSTKKLVKVTVREVHNKRCGGDPEVAPRLFDLEVNVKTGTAKWDYESPGDMQPIPKRR